MKAGDLVYNHKLFENSRGEVEELLCDVLEEMTGMPETDRRLSCGPMIDTLLHCLDILIVTDDEKAALVRLLDYIEAEV